MTPCLPTPPTSSGLDLNSVFVKRFGDLVALLRVDPGNDAAQDLALTAAASAVARAPVEVAAASEVAGSDEGLSLRARMIARQVDRLRIAAGAEPYELQAVARALAHHLTPIPAMPHVEVDLMPAPRTAFPLEKNVDQRCTSNPSTWRSRL